MSIDNKFVGTLENLLTEEIPSSNLQEEINYSNFTASDTQAEDPQKIKDLQKMLFTLNTKVSTLTNKVAELNQQIIDLTTLNEELIYMIDQGLIPEEDNEALLSVNFEDKKYELN